ncbi:MAG: hypothetical protein HC869_22970, partial [Rhodospirillales bacterium]|nr:hypothetical protein [Rhodospirillales bacterium]
MTADQFPMGLYSLQAANLVGWSGDQSNQEWRKLQSEVDVKMTPHAPIWLQRSIHALEADLMAERARVKAAESRARTLQEKVAQDARVVLDAERERDQAVDAAAQLKTKLEASERIAAISDARAAELVARLDASEAERIAALAKLNLTAAPVQTAGTVAGSVERSRGHVGIVDLIVLVLLAAGLILTATLASPQVYFRQVAPIVSIAGTAAAAWALVILIRVLRRRRIGWPVKSKKAAA